MSTRDLRAAAFLTIGGDTPVEWRTCFSTDHSDEPTGVAPVCIDEGHDEADGSVYDCCREPVIETGTYAMAAYLVDLLNVDREADGSQQRLSKDLAATASPALCACRRFPVVHRADLHDEDGLVRDIEQVARAGWTALVRARCTRCGWLSDASWFPEDFVKSPAQARISHHRDEATGKCAAESEASRD